MGTQVLVAEDDADQAELLRRYLEHESYAVTVVHDGQAAIDAVRAHAPDLVVLDVMLPGISGIDVCRLIRLSSDIPVLMVTARTGEDDVVLGLDAGADDYVTKPYSPRELAARARSMLRRVESPGGTEVVRVGRVVVDVDQHTVEVAGRPVATTPGEFRVLEVLARNAHRTLSRAQLLTELHGVDRYISARTIDGHVMNLRRKIEPDPTRPTQLLTVYGVGYRLVAHES